MIRVDQQVDRTGEYDVGWTNADASGCRSLLVSVAHSNVIVTLLHVHLGHRAKSIEQLLDLMLLDVILKVATENGPFRF